MKIIEEIIIANGISILMMLFLLDCRRKNRESIRIEDKIYDNMAVITLAGSALETIAFLVDGQEFSTGIFLNYFTNSLCFLGTVSVGFLWCIYVELHIYKNFKRTFRRAKYLVVPWIIEVVMILVNIFGTNVLFHITEYNVYHRGTCVLVGYVSLMIYFFYSIFVVFHSEKQGINVTFFPVMYFVGPCIAGVLIQFFHYGITAAWLSVALALTFVQMQNYSENLLVDDLSGLYNRRYMNRVLKKYNVNRGKSLYGIMMDVNDFKKINDNFGHSTGDHAISVMGDILTRALPEGGLAMRFAGDEFIILLIDAEEEDATQMVKDIHGTLARFNEGGTERFKLSVSAGYTQYTKEDTAESFLKHMDESMYEMKREYHRTHKKDI